MSRFFIERPIFASVIAIIVTLAGLVAWQVLPVAQYPEIAPPTVTITAALPGASAETLSRTVAAPIEEQLSGVEGLLYFQSTSSSNGTLTITCTFEVGTDVYTVTAQGRLIQPEEFGNIVLRASGPGGVLRVKDIARIELGAISYDAYTTVDGRPTIGTAVFLQSGANALNVANSVRKTMDEIAKGFPAGVNYMIPFDTTRFVQASIKEVIQTLFIAALLVLAVVFIFLQSWRATLIPFIAVPISLIGSFAGLYAFGFSINTLTLFAIVLATGIVVDDAIVVLENVERRMADQGLSPKEAAIESMREVTGA